MLSDRSAELSHAQVLDFRYAGVVRGVAVLSAWLLGHVFLLFGFALSWETAWILALTIPVQSFLAVGLFITAHDAMHGVLAPRHPRLNDALGRICLFAYAFFDYDALKRAHGLHHKNPASDHDPDFHGPGTSDAFWPWYARFMLGYMTWRQWLGTPIVFWTLWLVCRAPLQNVLCFWAAPAILSTFQLFYFGTYLPHRTPPAGYADAHRAVTSGYSRWWSFLTCYHFGKHWEHHAYPFIPWWKLGRLSAAALRETAVPAQV